MSEQKIEVDVTDELIDVAMKLILNAGDARLKLQEAVGMMKKLDFKGADVCMEEAKECLRLAHIAQTEIIQNETRGISYPHSLLFNHAQDTLMTIKSEYNMVEDMMGLFYVLYEKIENR